MPSNLSYINDKLFLNCESLTDITIPQTTTYIGNEAFSSCGSLTTIIIPPTVNYIGNAAFLSCISLDSIDIPYGISSIGAETFSACLKIRNITIPTSVKSIGNYAFENCRNLNTITIPSSVTSIGWNAFAECVYLSSFYASSIFPIILPNSYVFDNINKNTCTLYIPKGSLSLYKSAIGWLDFNNIQEFDVSALNNINDNFDDIFYNSCTKSVEFNGATTAIKLSIYNLCGKLCFYTTAVGRESINLQFLPKGIYVLRILINNKVISKKINI